MAGRKYLSTLILMTIAVLALSACGGSAPDAEESAPLPVVAGDFGITAEGRLVPADFVQLGFNQAGEVVEVLVQEGDVVQAGQLLARLDFTDNRPALEAAVAAGELELLSARQALDQLVEDHAMMAAEANLEMANAQDALKDAQYRQDVQQQGRRASGDTINAAEANLVLAQNEVDRAQKVYNKFSGRKEDDPSRAMALAKLVAAKQQRDAVLRQLNWYKGHPSDIDQAILTAEVAYAQARVETAERLCEDLENGPDPDAVALAEERIANAEAQLAAARAALADLDDQVPELVAPIGGVVAEMSLKQGENAMPGQVALVVADFSHWMVETEDLTELEVVEVSPGQAVTIVPDSLPEVELTGEVTAIGDMYQEKRGDITYTAEIQVDEIDPRLRWGMTVVVSFE